MTSATRTRGLLVATLPRDLANLTHGYFTTKSLRMKDIARAGIYEACDRRMDMYEIDRCIRGACLGGHPDIVKLLMARGWGYGVCNNSSFYTACRGGNMDIIEHMIACGMEYWDMGLMGACRGNQLECAKFMIERGATIWNGGLTNACRQGHRESIKLMIEHGATRCDYCYNATDLHLS